MITLNLLKFIADNGLGVVEIDGDTPNANLFWQKMSYDKVGVFISSVGNPTTRGSRKMQNFELFSRGTNDLTGAKQLADILELLDKSFNVCKLPAVYDCDGNELAKEANNVQIMPTSSITNYGSDENGRIIYSASGSIYY